MPNRLRVHRIAIALVFSSLAACGSDEATNPPDPPATQSGERLEITFAYGPGPGSAAPTMELFHSTSDGSLTKPFLSTPDAEYSPEWSRDGSRLLFTRAMRSGAPAYTISVVNGDGTALRQLDIDPAAPPGNFLWSCCGSWSPNGQSIVFHRSLNEQEAGLGVINADGTGLRWLLVDPAIDVPSWSVGGRIAFGRNGSIWTINPDGSGLLRVTSLGDDGWPKWSRDGTRLVFLSRTTQSGLAGWDIVTTRADGTDRRTLVTGGNNTRASWSSDGQYILYERFDSPDPVAPMCTVHKVPSAGGADVNLTPERTIGSCGGAAWRPM